MIWIWLLLCAGLLLTELLLGEMTALMLCLGALAAVGIAAAGLGPLWQALVFGGVSLGMVVFLRPLMRHWLQPAETVMGTDGFVGQEAEVLDAISPARRGRVKLHGEIWNASSYEQIEAGEAVYITGLRDNCLDVVPHYALRSQVRIDAKIDKAELGSAAAINDPPHETHEGERP